MKKILIGLAMLIAFTGCDMSKLNNTPTKQTELFLSKYQKLDTAVLSDLDSVVAEEEKFNAEQRERYRDIMKKHYQDLVYSIKEETIDGDDATVTVEIEVKDNTKALAEADVYLEEHPEEFNDDNGEYSEKKFMDYRLDQLKNNKETVKYTLELTLIKKDGKWQMNQLSENQGDKINGVYIY